VRTADRLPVLRVGDVDARADDVLRASAELSQRGDDDFEAALRLLVRVGGVAADRRRACDVDVLPGAHGPRVADGVGERRECRDEATSHAPSIDGVEALRLIDGWDAPDAAAGVVGVGGVVAAYGAADVAMPWASVTKLLTGLTFLVALEEGTVDLDEPAGPPGSTLRHLLSHASGLPLDGAEPMAEPGRRRIYSNTGIEVAADLLAERAEMPFADYLTHAVVEPLGLRGGLAGSPAYGYNGPLADLLALGRELLAPRLVAPETIEEAATVQFPGLTGVLPGLGRMEPSDWGLTFEVRDGKSPHWTGSRNSPRTFGHFGRTGTFLWVDPDAGVACGVLTGRAFGDWAVEAWPAFSDAVLAEVGPAVREVGPNGP
jgi:CubicO group peptidase (beta-lactamase class C family)